MSTYTQRDFSEYCKGRGVKPETIFRYVDSDGQEHLTSLDNRLDWNQKVARIQRFIIEAEQSCVLTRKIVKRARALEKSKR